jgi:hypothetical protein
MGKPSPNFACFAEHEMRNKSSSGAFGGRDKDELAKKLSMDQTFNEECT